MPDANGIAQFAGEKTGYRWLILSCACYHYWMGYEKFGELIGALSRWCGGRSNITIIYVANDRALRTFSYKELSVFNKKNRQGFPMFIRNYANWVGYPMNEKERAYCEWIIQDNHWRPYDWDDAWQKFSKKWDKKPKEPSASADIYV